MSSHSSIPRRPITTRFIVLKYSTATHTHTIDTYTHTPGDRWSVHVIFEHTLHITRLFDLIHVTLIFYFFFCTQFNYFVRLNSTHCRLESETYLISHQTHVMRWYRFRDNVRLLHIAPYFFPRQLISRISNLVRRKRCEFNFLFSVVQILSLLSVQ